MLDSIKAHELAINTLNSHATRSCIELLMKNESPIFISTDGSHVGSLDEKGIQTSSTTGAAVVCMMDLRDNESIADANWINRPAIPIMARATRLPKFIGSSEVEISHGEGVALCMGLEIFCRNMPKVFIMDSSVIRDTALKIRERKAQMAKDRMYIRKVASGVSKHLCKRMEESLCNTDVNDTSSHPFASKQNQTVEFLTICEKWTQEVSKEKHEDKDWSSNYWDNDDINTILKVDSHQLDKQGRKIKKNPRYSKLVPNLFLLNCNYYAGVVADLLHQNQFSNTQQSPAMMLPSSNLRFFLTNKGVGIDKHVSESLRMAFQDARINEIKKRHTQGLPWRILDHSTIGWADLQKCKGLFRSLRGLSRTHTRSLYKSATYRQGWIKEELSKASSNVLKCLPAPSSAKWTELLTPCKWCINTLNSKGNRYHATLFCGEPKLEKFRDNMTMLLEQRLDQFVKLIRRTQNDKAADSFLDDIEFTLQKLHASQQITKDTVGLSTSYWNRKKWMEEEQMHSMEELLNSSIPIYSLVFGFQPASEQAYSSDRELTPAMCIPLGIPSKMVEKQIKALSRNLANFCLDKTERKRIEEQYWNCWKEVKEIVEARMVGLHRIIGNVSHEFEAMFRKKYNLDQNTFKEGVSKNSSNSDNMTRTCTVCATANVTTDEGVKKRKSVGNADTAQGNSVQAIVKRRKFCSGITCNPQFKLWNFDFKPNEIPSEKKHCQRCARHQTAIRKGVNALDSCGKTDKKELSQNLIRQMDENPNELRYAKLSENLKQIELCGDKDGNKTMMETSKVAVTRKRKGIPDDRKTMIKVIATSISRLTNKDNESDKRIKCAMIKLKKTNANIETFLKDDLRDTKNINKRVLSLSCDKKYTVETTVISTSEKENAQQKTVIRKLEKEEEATRKDIAHTLGANQWMHSFSMDRAIKFIRNLASAEIFIADTFISTLLQNWNNNLAWERVAVAFRNKTVISRKPNGVYIIPIFTGCSSQGHWSTAVVYKETSCSKGWILDSLGNSNLDSNPAKAIKSIFTTGRRNFRWTRLYCRNQVEVECGSRTIVAMVGIVRSLVRGVNIEDAVNSATLMQRSDYDPADIRRRAAACMRLSSEGIAQDQRREKEVRDYLKRVRKRAQRKLRSDERTIRGETVEILDEE